MVHSRPSRPRLTCSSRCRQGTIDATAVTSTVAFATANDPNFRISWWAAMRGYPMDYVSLIALREEYGFINYLNLFVNQQVRDGPLSGALQQVGRPGRAAEPADPGRLLLSQYSPGGAQGAPPLARIVT